MKRILIALAIMGMAFMAGCGLLDPQGVGGYWYMSQYILTNAGVNGSTNTYTEGSATIKLWITNVDANNYQVTEFYVSTTKVYTNEFNADTGIVAGDTQLAPDVEWTLAVDTTTMTWLFYDVGRDPVYEEYTFTKVEAQ